MISDMSDYDHVSRSSLKLKHDGLSASKKNKKKKKKKEKLEKKQLELVEQTLLDNSTTATTSTSQAHDKSKATDSTSWMTEAQKKFLAQQEKRQLARVMEKATKSHKQRVEEFNNHLEVCIDFSFLLNLISSFLIFTRIYLNTTTYPR